MSTKELACEDDAPTTAEGAADQDVEHQHWQAIIACLPTAAKREAAWDFYSRRLANAGTAADLLSGFVLLLEAHSLYLEQLPARCHKHFILPFEAQQRALQTTILDFQQRQGEALAALEKVSARNIRVAARAVITVHTVRKRLHEAATSIDAQALVNGVSKQLEEKALTPLAAALSALVTKMSACEQTAAAVQASVECWRRVHLAGTVLCGWGAAVLVCVALFFAGWVRLERAQEQKADTEREAILAATAKNQEIIRLLGGLRVVLRLRPVMNDAGERVPDTVLLSVEPEWKSDVRLQPGDRTGVTLLHTPQSAEVLRKMREWLDKPRP